MTEPWPLREAERKTMHAVYDGNKILKTWTRPGTTAKWRSEHSDQRDTALTNLRFVRDQIDTDRFVFHEGGEFRRVGMKLSLQESIDSVYELLEQLKATTVDVPEVPEADRPSLAEKAFNCVLVTHVLAGQIQDPEGAGDTPLVYAGFNEENELEFVNWRGRMSADKTQLFNIQGLEGLRLAALIRYNQVSVCHTLAAVSSGIG
jgi:hypothetical protein